MGVISSAAGGFSCFRPCRLGVIRSAQRSQVFAVVPPPSLPSPDGNQKPVDLVLDADSAASAPGLPPQPWNSPTSRISPSRARDRWTAVGGHGSDATLRTSEALARETSRPQAPGAWDSGDARANQSESNLRAALAVAPGSFEANHQLGEFYLRAGNYQYRFPSCRPRTGSIQRTVATSTIWPGPTKKPVTSRSPVTTSRNCWRITTMPACIDCWVSWTRKWAIRWPPSRKMSRPSVWIQANRITSNGARSYYFTGRCGKRRKFSRVEPKRIRSRPVCWLRLGTALFAGALYDQAADSLCQASDLNPADTEPYLFMGRIEMAAPKPLACIEPRLASVCTAAARKLARELLLRHGHLETAATADGSEGLAAGGNPARQSRGHRSYVWRRLPAASGSSLFPNGILKSAIGFYGKAIEVDPQLGEAHYRLGVAYDRTRIAGKGQTGISAA